MAYVGISRELKQDIRRRIRNMDEVEAIRLRQALYPADDFTQPLAGPEWKARIESAAWAGHEAHRTTLPEEWLVQAKAIDVRFTYIDESGAAIAAEQLRYADPAGVLTLPPNYKADYVGDIDLRLEGLGDSGARLIRWHLAHNQNQERFDKVWGSIDMLLGRCKSMNEAVDLFPDLRFYLDEHTLKRLDEKRGKKQGEPDPRLEGVDTALITSAAVLGKINEGNG